MRQGMGCFHKLLQPLFQDMRVNLGGRDVGVTKQLLDGSKVSTVLQKVACKCVAQDMG